MLAWLRYGGCKQRVRFTAAMRQVKLSVPAKLQPQAGSSKRPCSPTSKLVFLSKCQLLGSRSVSVRRVRTCVWTTLSRDGKLSQTLMMLS